MPLVASCALVLALLGSWLIRQPGGTTAARVPDDYVELQRVTRGADRFVFSRRKLAAELAVWEQRGDRLERLTLDARHTTSLYFLHAVVSGEAVYLIAYNTTETVPEGRSRDEYRNGIDVYRLDRDADGQIQLREIGRMLPVGSIDSVFYDAPIAGGIASCAELGCIVFAGGDPQVIVPPAWKGRELIEVAGDGSRAFGLFQSMLDDRVDRLPSRNDAVHFVCAIAAASTCEALPAKVPAELSMADGAWRIRFAESRDERVAVLVRDLERSPERRFVADTNLEGRVAWGQVYVLEALVDILASGQAFPPALVSRARQRLNVELDGLAALSRAEPWFWSKRYSMRRERIASIVHLGRISSLVSRARRLPGVGDQAELSRGLIAELTSLERTIEQRDQRTFAVKRGAPFWIDGAPVPWNFQSAWIEAIARDGPATDAIGAMVGWMAAQERLSELPQLWRYAWGPVHEGWTRADNVSSNTPEWEGNKTRDIGGMAHISYRSMDARALLAAHRLRQVPLPPGLIDHLRRLTESGRLRPWVSAELVPLGMRPELDHAIARMYSRTGRPIQIQDQVWAVLLAAP